jgi:hypothetical protein
VEPAFRPAASYYFALSFANYFLQHPGADFVEMADERTEQNTKTQQGERS